MNLREEVSNILGSKEGKWMTSAYLRKKLTRANHPSGVASTLAFLVKNGNVERVHKTRAPGCLSGGQSDHSSYAYRLLKEYSGKKNYTDHRKVPAKTSEHTTSTITNDATMIGDLLNITRKIVRNELTTREIVDGLLEIAANAEEANRLVTINVGGARMG
jgi:hypothetical protein